MIEVTLQLDLGDHTPGDQGIGLARSLAVNLKELAVEYAATAAEASGSEETLAARPVVRYRVALDVARDVGEWRGA